VRVLVIDASAAIRTRLVARLHEAGLEVAAEADTVAAALVQVAAHRPDAIVVDVLLADGRGPDVVAALRAAAPVARVVVVSNATHYRRSCLERGADCFLDKSSEFDAVAVTLLV
jgi:DNA-binding NarL/FixJ family response regulator